MPTDRRQTCKTPGCGNQFTRPQGTNRLYCFQCRPERKILEFPGGSAEKGLNGAENQDQEGPMTRMSRLRLEELGVTETWQAAAVMALAVSIDEGKMAGTAGIAGIIRGHREAMAVAEALSDVDDGDVIDAIFGAQEA